MIRYFIIFTFLFLWCLPYSIAQEVTPEIDLKYDVDRFVLPGGPLGNNVNSIVEGPNGFIWFGSHGGVHRYDGFEFITYNDAALDTVGESTTLTYPYVENLYWDSRGYLWVATYGGGLYRFDPRNEIFKHFEYRTDDSTTIAHPRVISAVEDVQGRMWFGTEKGLSRYEPDTETFTNYYADRDDPTSIHDDDIRKLYVDRQGTLWLGTGFAGFEILTGALTRYNPKTDDFTNFTHDPNDKTSISSSAVRGIFEDTRGNFWVGTDQGLNRMDRENGTFEKMEYRTNLPYAPGAEDRPDPVVYSILEDDQDGLWVGTIFASDYRSHLLRYSYQDSSYQVFPIQTYAWDMLQSTDGTIWVAGAGLTNTVLKISPKAITYDLHSLINYFDAFISSNLKRELQIDGIEFDLSGPLEMVLDTASGDIWTTMTLDDQRGTRSRYPLLSKYVSSTAQIEFFVLSGLSTYEGAYNSLNIRVAGMFMDDSGRIWGSIASDSIGLFNFDVQTGQVQQFLHDPLDSASISSNNISTIFKSSTGDIWVGTQDNGLNKIDPNTGEITRFYFEIEGSYDYNRVILTLIEGNDGNIWAAGQLHDFGRPFMAIIDPETNEYRNRLLPMGSTFLSIQSMTQSPITDHIIFITDNGRIGNFFPNKNELTIFSESESGFPINQLADIVCDKQGIFWAAGNERSEFVRFGESMDYIRFESRGGPSSRWRKGKLGPDGNVYFVSRRGWFQIEPDKMQFSSQRDSSAIKLVDLYIFGERQVPGRNGILDRPVQEFDKISLPSDAETFAFAFSHFLFQNQDAQFEYRLFPFENLWKKSKGSPVANYYKVPSGEYQFQVRHLSFSGNSQSRMLDIPVKILPPWWRTWWAYGIYGILFILAALGIHRIQKERVVRAERERNRQKELEHAKEIEKAYADLKNTQAQLVQSEKMASLGELTAGIAHEIQNPLNFVNNFSEVSSELIHEAKEELDNSRPDEVKDILTDLQLNLDKIHHHGDRASSIVQNMLQHSRPSTEEKIETDINALCDEFVRLAYHGLRAKDKTFNAAIDTQFDDTLPKLKVVPQDIGRVLLNIFNNAFYAVDQLKKSIENGYAPMVKIQTAMVEDTARICIEDNGGGIPEEMIDKIFQPFFTTKPTGKGTGLGLSLSYDIVKAHRGKLQVEIIRGDGKNSTPKGTKFIIELPVHPKKK